MAAGIGFPGRRIGACGCRSARHSRAGGARVVPGICGRLGVRARPARPDLRPAGAGRPRAPRRRPAGRARRSQAGGRAPGQPRPQRHAAVHQRRRRQALVQRPRDVAGIPLHAGHAALQPLQPRPRHRLRLPAPTSPTRYFLFAYPFLLAVPGYDVRVPQLPDAERDRNLEMLRFIAEQTVARGLRVPAGPLDARLRVDRQPQAELHHRGTDAARPTAPTAAMRCGPCSRPVPAISGVTFRVHGESGVEEGSYEFWKTVFDGVATCGRKVEIDMHAKGMDQGMIDVALGYRPAGEDLAQVLGRAPGPALPPGRHPRAGTAAPGRRGDRA